MTRTTQQALAWTRTRGPIPNAKGEAVGASGWCKRETRTAYDVPSDGSLTAAAASRRADLHTQTAPPHGALLWWTGGSEGEGHVAINDHGTVRTVDYPTPGRWGTAPSRAELERHWTKLHYVGWSPDIDGVTVVKLPKPKPKPSRIAVTRDRLEHIAATAPTPARRRAAAAAAAVLKGFR